MNIVSRNITKELIKASKEYPIIAILGPRQSGKSTLAKSCFPQKDYISLENIDDREFALTDPKGFIRTYKSGATIDEIQRVPSLLSYLQTEVDNDPRPGRFIITGSNQYSLQQEVTQSLAGRVSLLKLLPFSLSEVQTLKSNFELEDILFTGFYPRIHVENVRPIQWLDNYIETYVDKDIRLIRNIENLAQFTLFIKMVASRVGQLVNLSSISNDCGIAQNTVKSWLSLLESSFIIKLVNPHHENFGKRLVKSTKIYFIDTGLLCRLLNVKNAEELKSHALRGGIFESFIYSEFLKFQLNHATKEQIYFWRDKNGHEIDFLIEDKTIKLIEVKSGKTISKDFFKNLNYYKGISTKDNKFYLVYAGENNQIREEVTVLSWKNLNQILK